MGKHLPDTRETVQQEYRYLMFDVAIDRFLEGDQTLDQAVLNYQRMLGGTVLLGAVESVEGV